MVPEPIPPPTPAERARLLARADHDLRTPLAVLRGWVETLRTAGEKLGPERRGMGYETLARTVEDLSALIETVLAEVRASALAGSVAPEVVPVHTWLEEAVVAGIVVTEDTDGPQVLATRATAPQLARSAARLLGLDPRSRSLRAAWEVHGEDLLVSFSPSGEGEDAAVVSATYGDLLHELRLQSAALLASAHGGEISIDDDRVTVRMPLA